MKVVIECSVCGKDWYAPNDDCLLKHDTWPGGEIWRSINNNPAVMVEPADYQRILERLRDLECAFDESQAEANRLRADRDAFRDKWTIEVFNRMQSNATAMPPTDGSHE